MDRGYIKMVRFWKDLDELEKNMKKALHYIKYMKSDIYRNALTLKNIEEAQDVELNITDNNDVQDLANIMNRNVVQGTSLLWDAVHEQVSDINGLEDPDLTIDNGYEGETWRELRIETNGPYTTFIEHPRNNNEQDHNNRHLRRPNDERRFDNNDNDNVMI